ncbi:MAG: hypothetical protein ABL965_10010 [Nitrospira sp.]|jgi:hypothetical protein|nr:MAG: hypothetical protein E8D44_13490 [Nitrospira sp.]
MHTRVKVILGFVGVLALGAIGLPALWHHPEEPGLGIIPEALASGDEMKEAIREHLTLAEEYEKDAAHHEAEAKRYEQKASAITPLMDTKGFRRDGLKIAADSHSSMASEARFRAKVHRLEMQLLMEKDAHGGNEK